MDQEVNQSYIVGSEEATFNIDVISLNFEIKDADDNYKKLGLNLINPIAISVAKKNHDFLKSNYDKRILSCQNNAIVKRIISVQWLWNIVENFNHESVMNVDEFPIFNGDDNDSRSSVYGSSFNLSSSGYRSDECFIWLPMLTFIYYTDESNILGVENNEWYGIN
ncbi:hypothetical protein U3516DRAFT_742384 [Neocallimastix sp. 'constans']